MASLLVDKGPKFPAVVTEMPLCAWWSVDNVDLSPPGVGRPVGKLWGTSALR